MVLKLIHLIETLKRNLNFVQGLKSLIFTINIIIYYIILYIIIIILLYYYIIYNIIIYIIITYYEIFTKTKIN